MICLRREIVGVSKNVVLACFSGAGSVFRSSLQYYLLLSPLLFTASVGVFPKNVHVLLLHVAKLFSAYVVNSRA